MAVWQLADGTSKVSQFTTISEDGTLYLGLGQSAGTIIVKGGEESDVLGTATVTCVVENVVTSPENILANNSASGSRQITIKVGDRNVTGGTWTLEKTHSTEIASDTKVSSTGVVSWTTKQQSGQIGVKWTKDGVTKTIPVVFKKSSIKISPSTVTVKNGDTQKFTIS